MTEHNLLTGQIEPVRVTSKGVSVRDAADMLFRQKAFISVWVCIVGALFAVYLVMAPARYRSHITFLLMSERPVPAVSQEELRSGGLAEEVTESQIATEMQLLSSTELLRRVVEQCHLVPKDPSGVPAQQLEKAETKLSKSLKVTPDGKSDLITVQYRGYSPKQTVQVLQTLADSYLDRHLELHRVAGDYEFFREQAAHFENQWRDAQARMSAFELRTKVVVLDEQKDLGIRKLNDLEASLRETQTAVSEAEHREAVLLQELSQAAPRITTQVRAIPNQYSAERLNTMIAELSNRRTELLTKFRPDNRLVQEVDQQIAQTKSALRLASASDSKEQETDVNPLRQGLEGQLVQSRAALAGLRARAETLAAQIAQYGAKVDNLGNATAGYDLLARDVKEAEAKYLLYSRQSEEARISDEMDRKRMANVVVADGPELPAAPEPKFSLDVVAGFIFALLMIGPIAFVRGLRRNQVFTPWELEGVVGVPVLGAVAEAS